MYCDDAFFAQSKIEPLIWDQDPVDHPLMDAVPPMLIARAQAIVGGSPFRTRRPKPAVKRAPRIGIVRNGRRRAEVALQIGA